MSCKSSSSGAVTPTSDFVDDSGVSEDNASSVNSGSEQGSSIYRSVRTTPKSFATTSRERDIDAIDNDDIDDANNNTINKSRSNSGSSSHASSAASIIHLSPGGSTVIEYKTVSNLPLKSHTIPNTSSSLSNSNPVIVSTNGISNVIKTISTQHSSIQSSTASTPHTHFHKKYIKAMNALNGPTTDPTATMCAATIGNSSPEAQMSSSPTIVSVSAPTTIYTIPMKAEFR